MKFNSYQNISRLTYRLLPFILYSFVLIAIGKLFTGSYFSLGFFTTFMLFLLPGYILSNLFFHQISCWDLRHVATSFALSLGLFALPSYFCFLFHTSSGTAFTLATSVLIGASVLGFLASFERYSKKNITDEDTEEVDEGSYPISHRIASLSWTGVLAVIAIQYQVANIFNDNHFLKTLTLSIVIITYAIFSVRRWRKSKVTEDVEAGILEKGYIYNSVKTGIAIVVAILVLFTIQRNINNLEWNPDNVYYQSAIADFVDSEELNKYEPTMDEGIEPPSFFASPTWELLNAYLSKLSGVKTFIVYNHFIPIPLLILVFLSGWALLRELVNKKTKLLFSGLIPLGLFMIWNTTAHGVAWGIDYSTFRINQPKVVLMYILTPYFLSLFLRFKRNPGLTNSFVCMLAAFGATSIHVMAFPLFGLYIGFDFLISILKKRKLTFNNIKKILLMVPSFAFIIVVLIKLTAFEEAIMAASTTGPLRQEMLKLLADNLVLWVALLILGAYLKYFWKRDSAGILLGPFIFLLVVAAVPNADSIAYRIITTPIAGRIGIIIPAYIIIGFWFAIHFRMAHFKSKLRQSIYIITPLILIILTAFATLDGKIDDGLKLQCSPNRYKIRNVFADIVDYFSSIDVKKEISVIAPRNASQYIPTAHGRSKMYIARDFYTDLFVPDQVRDKRDFLTLLYLVREDGWRIDPNELEKILQNRRVDHVILRSRRINRGRYLNFFRSIGFNIVRKNPMFITLRKEKPWISSNLGKYISNLSSIQKIILRELKKHYYKVKYKLPKKAAEYFADSVPVSEYTLFPGDYRKRFHFQKGCTGIREYSLAKAGWVKSGLNEIQTSMNGDIKSGLDLTLADRYCYLRQLENISFIYLSMPPGYKYKINLFIHEFTGSDQKVVIDIDNIEYGKIVLKADSYRILNLSIDKRNDFEPLSRIELQFNKYIPRQLWGLTERKEHLSADIFAVSVEPED